MFLRRNLLKDGIQMKIGIVLAGGVAKGAYQAGFLKALEEYLGRENVKCVAGSSIGAINGYCFCADKTDQLVNVWSKVHFDSVFDLFQGIWFKRFLKDRLKEVLCIEDNLKMPLYSTICHYPIIKIKYCKLYGKYNPKWYSFMRGAMGFPVITGGLKFFEGLPSVDGGMVDNVPILPMIKKDSPDLILVLHFSSVYRTRKVLLEEGVPIIDFDISIKNEFRKRSFDFHHDTITSMLDSGYEYGVELSKSLFRGKLDDIEGIMKATEEQKKKEHKLRSDNYTFDTFVEKLNAFFYPFMRHDCKNFKDLSLTSSGRKL